MLKINCSCPLRGLWQRHVQIQVPWTLWHVDKEISNYFLIRLWPEILVERRCRCYVHPLDQHRLVSVWFLRKKFPSVNRAHATAGSWLGGRILFHFYLTCLSIHWPQLGIQLQSPQDEITLHCYSCSPGTSLCTICTELKQHCRTYTWSLHITWFCQKKKNVLMKNLQFTNNRPNNLFCSS